MSTQNADAGTILPSSILRAAPESGCTQSPVVVLWLAPTSSVLSSSQIERAMLRSIARVTFTLSPPAVGTTWMSFPNFACSSRGYQ